MAILSNYAENHIIDAILRGVAIGAPTALYIALFTATPSASGGGTEVAGGSYARINLAPTAANWASTGGATTVTNPSVGTTGTTSNNAAITFAAPTASWGVITSFAIFDAVSGGNMWFFGNLTVSKTVNNGDAAPSFAISALSLTMT